MLKNYMIIKETSTFMNKVIYNILSARIVKFIMKATIVLLEIHPKFCT